jgi:hypothetical protein
MMFSSDSVECGRVMSGKEGFLWYTVKISREEAFPDSVSGRYQYVVLVFPVNMRLVVSVEVFLMMVLV